MVSQAPAETGLVGAVLSRRYRLTRELGAGGMGSVYATDQLIDGRGVAVKVLHAEYVQDKAVRERFLAEAATIQRLVHPNILRVFGTEEAEDGTPYIVMEHLEGVPLSAYTQNGGRVPLHQAISITQGMLAGLAAAHAQGIVHRDLKPENVFLARDGGPQFVIKLLDFGIAKVMDVAGGMGAKTRTGMLLGTPAYMSPEQIRNAKDVDPRSDLWSVGVMLYEMLSGRTAFPAPTEYARLFAVLNNNPEPIEKLDRELAPMAGFMARALEKAREQRFQSATEMNRSLSALAGPDNTQSRAMPLSRLPDVPSLFQPSLIGAGIGTEPRPVAPTAETPAMPPMPTTGPSGTLTSPARADHINYEARAPVVIVENRGETLPSKDLPMLPAVSSGAPQLMRRGISPALLVTLVLIALLAGFSIGFAVGRGVG